MTASKLFRLSRIALGFVIIFAVSAHSATLARTPEGAQQNFFFWLAVGMLCTVICMAWIVVHQRQQIVETRKRLGMVSGLVDEVNETLVMYEGQNDRIWDYAAMMYRRAVEAGAEVPSFNQYVRDLIFADGRAQAAEALLSSDSPSSAETDHHAPEAEPETRSADQLGSVPEPEIGDRRRQSRPSLRLM